MTRLNKAVLAALTGAAAGFLAWNVMMRRRRRISERRSAGTVSPAPPPPALRSAPGDVDARLDEAIEESFPASDPVSIRIE